MMRRIVSATIGVAFVLAVSSLAASGDEARGKVETKVETVGGFAVKLAAVRGRAASTPEAAAASLRSAGVNVNLTADLGAKLTHDTATRILADLGVKVANPAAPENEITVALSRQLALSLSRSNILVGTAGMPPAPDPTDLPMDCLVAVNFGTCQECCKVATSCGNIREDPDTGDPLPGSQPPFPCNHCAKFCKSFQPPDISPEAPQP